MFSHTSWTCLNGNEEVMMSALIWLYMIMLITTGETVIIYTPAFLTLWKSRKRNLNWTLLSPFGRLKHNVQKTQIYSIHCNSKENTTRKTNSKYSEVCSVCATYSSLSLCSRACCKECITTIFFFRRVCLAMIYCLAGTCMHSKISVSHV